MLADVCCCVVNDVTLIPTSVSLLTGQTSPVKSLKPVSFLSVQIHFV